MEGQCLLEGLIFMDAQLVCIMGMPHLQDANGKLTLLGSVRATRNLRLLMGKFSPMDFSNGF